jgi:hypothetical protein
MKINNKQKTNDIHKISGNVIPDPQRLLLWGPFGLALLIPGLFFVWLFNYSRYQEKITNHIAGIFFALMMIIIGITIIILGFFQRPGIIRIYKTYFDYSYPTTSIDESEILVLEYKEILRIETVKKNNNISCIKIKIKNKKIHEFLYINSAIANQLIETYKQFKSNHIELNN